MTQEGVNVTVDVATVITDQGEKETIQQTYEGKFLSRDSIDVLIFEEKNEANEMTRNLITIQPDKINIKRTGAITMNQQFIANQRTECFFEHMYGSFHLETETHS